MRKASLDYIRDHPSSVAKSFFWNTVRLFDLQGAGPAVTYATYVPYPKGLTRIAVYSSWLVMALAVVAAAMGLLRAIPRSVWLFPLLVYLNLAFLAGNYRYRAAIEPLFVIAAAAAVVALTELWSAKRSGRARDGDERMTEREVAPAQDAPLA
jgi:hypothetical protein